MKLQNHKPFRETQLTANLLVKKEKYTRQLTAPLL